MKVQYTQDLLDRAQAHVSKTADKRRYAEGLAEISELYREITGEAVGTCRQCQYSDYLTRLQSYIREATRHLHPETMSESKYTIAPGLENETFVHESLNSAVTAETLTDETAEFLMKHGWPDAFVLKPGHEKAAKSEKPGDGAARLTEKQQAQARYAELFGSPADEKVTTNDLKTHIAAKEADAEYQVPVA